MKNILKLLLYILSLSLLSACGDASSKKWRLNNKNLTSDEVASLKAAIFVKEKIEEQNTWKDLEGYAWAGILRFFPEEAKKCTEFNGWNKLDGSNWVTLLSEGTRFEKKCNEFAGWRLMSSEDWIRLISSQPKYLEKADKENVWDKFTNKNWMYVIKSNSQELKRKCEELNAWNKLKKDDWVDLLAFNSKIKQIAKEFDVFKKLTPSDWINLISVNPEYTDLMRQECPIDKLPIKELIRLYCLQPKLRNDIFQLNKIDIDLANGIEHIYKQFGENGSNLSSKELIVAIKIFPELKKRINEETFVRYDVNSWSEILVADKDIYECISKKYAYLVSWKEFNLSDWVKILDKRDLLFEMFKRYIDIKKLSYSEIRRALNDASLFNLSTFEKYDFWKDFTEDQYASLIKDDGDLFSGMLSLAGAMSGKPIRSIHDAELAINTIDNKWKETLEETLFGGGNPEGVKAISYGDIEKLSGELKNMENSTNAKIIYDRTYIIKKAKENNIIEKFSDEHWKYLNETKNSEEIMKEYFLLHEKDKDLSKIIPDLLTFKNIKKYNLWRKLTPEQYINLNLGSYFSDNTNFNDFFNAINENKLWETFDSETKVKLFMKFSFFSRSMDLSVWAKAIPPEFWSEIFAKEERELTRCNHRYYNYPLIKHFDFSKMSSLDFLKLIKVFYENAYKDREAVVDSNHPSVVQILHPRIVHIADAFDVNRLSKEDLLELLKYDIYLSYVESKSGKIYCPKLHDFTAKDWIDLHNRYKNSHHGYKDIYEKDELRKAFNKMAKISNFSDSDKKELEKIGLHIFSDSEKIELEKKKIDF